MITLHLALEAERVGGWSPRDAIFQVRLLLLWLIVMTTMAAILGVRPLMPKIESGWKPPRQLAFAIGGGLIIGHVMVLTISVIHLYVDHLTVRDRRSAPSLPTGEVVE